MLRFYIALWAAKLFYFINKLIGRARDDRPGLLAFKICPDFLARIGKPKLMITITGTNGKTTTSALINSYLKEQGLRVSFNDWGANLHAGYCLNLMRCVNIFNKVTKMDASVLEADEKTLAHTMGMIKPHYVLVTNISKDSLRRNGHPEYIFDCVEKCFEKLGADTTAILNANDPISSELARNTGAKRVFYGMDDIGSNPFENMVKDIAVCPRCGGELKYNYRQYRHIGDYYCADCDFKTKDAKFYATKVDLKARTMDILEDGETTTYPLISETIFNAFNVLSAAAALRTMGYEKASLAEFFERQKVTEIRETCVKYKGKEFHTYGAKSQNVSAASTVFEYMAKEKSDKIVVLCMDEVQDKNHPTETLTWLYETDFEFLNSPNIKQIVVAGHMYLNHRLRLMLAGVDPNKIAACEDESKVADLVDFSQDFEKLYVLFEIDYVTKGRNWRDAIVEKAKEVM
ncbi:MAG: MurT ligase domain-containing protein [Clostridia bacterium]|nr:MurT ligase domain-containing protein [Clostridia bacterium]